MRYQTLKENSEALKSFVKEGILSYNWIRDVEIFEEFHELYARAAKKCKSCLFADIAVKRGLIPETIKNIIYELSK